MREMILEEIYEERERQEKKFPNQSLPGYHIPACNNLADDGRYARWRCEGARKEGNLTWTHVLYEEVCEAVDEAMIVDGKTFTRAEKEEARGNLRAELIQVAAVAVRWIEQLDAEDAQKENA